jgi:menaquinone-dependent protoporphyrinogen oxidase
MKRILVAYSTNAGSTAEVAQAVADTLASAQVQVDLSPLSEVSSAAGYDGVIVGAPMILGWQRAALQFVKRHQQALASVPVAYFCTLISLTQPGADQALPAPVYIDPELPKAPRNPGRLSIKERYATLGNYLRPILKAAPAVHPVSVAFIGGKLELFRLKWWQMLFVMVIIQAQPGDRRNWAGIQQWAESLRPCLNL